MVEAKLTEHEKLLEKLAEVQKEIAASIKVNVQLHNELRKLREELESLKKLRESKLMVIPKAEKVGPDGSVVREYELYPALKAEEKKTDFMVDKLGSAIIEELRTTRAELTSIANRFASLIETVTTR